MRIKTNKPLLYTSVSLLTVCATALTGVASAQDTAKTGGDTEVIVVGVRKSLKTAQQIKKDADTVVDSITATDIGAFPDKSVAEALQRVAGITVTRFAATGDTSHFSAEPSGVIVRGLSQVRSEFNGRDTFSANSSRGLSWGDVTPELMAGVDTYKNQTAEMIEGGIAGSINLRTRVPFDSKKQLIAVSVDGLYGSLSKKMTPDASAIYSDRWDTSLGEFGVMANAAYSQVITNSEGDQVGRMVHFAPGVLSARDNYIPTGISIYQNQYDRRRTGVALAGQWQNHQHSMLATLQYNRSDYKNTWNEHSVGSSWGYYGDVDGAHPQNFVETSNTALRPAPGTTLNFDQNGVLTTGTINGSYDWTGNWYPSAADAAAGTNINQANWNTNPATAYFPANSTTGVARHFTGSNASFFNACVSGLSGNPGNASVNGQNCPIGASISSSTRYNDSSDITQDASFNLKWDPTERLKLNFDVQYVQSAITNYDVTVVMNTYGNLGMDLTGKYPKVSLTAPTNVNVVGGADFLGNPDNYHYDNVQDHTEDSDGHELATRFDAQYEFGGGWLDSLKAGVRYADREQDVRWGAYNWANVANNWSQNGAYYMVDSPLYKPGGYYTDSFGTNVLGRGDLITGHNFVFTNKDVISSQSALRALLGAPSNPQLSGTDANGNHYADDWDPICSNTNHRAGETDIEKVGCYKPVEVLSVSEKTLAGYLMLKFGGHDAKIFENVGVSGNVGVRWVQTEDAAKGGVTFPSAYSSAALNCVPLDAQGRQQAQANNQYPTTTQCLLAHNADAVAFANGGSQLNNDTHTHINWLPSANVKFQLNDHWILRLAASRAMSRPDMVDLKNYLTITPSAIPSTALDKTVNDPNRVFDSQGNLYSYKIFYSGQAGNSALKSTTADQFDISVEDYFAPVGSFTFDLFYKKFHDYIQSGQYTVRETNNGISENVTVTGPVNGEGANIKGFEVAYQRTFDFLPAPFNGLGVQTNFTHIHNTGITNTNLSGVAGGEGVTTSAATNDNKIDPGVLEGLSDNSYNVVMFYDKGKFGARLAYNWRSKYLVTAQDCCTSLPVWQRAAGYLDGSVRYAVTDNVELSLQASNILNTITKLQQEVQGPTKANPNTPALFLPSAYFGNDSRVQVGVRIKY